MKTLIALKNNITIIIDTKDLINIYSYSGSIIEFEKSILKIINIGELDYFKRYNMNIMNKYSYLSISFEVYNEPVINSFNYSSIEKTIKVNYITEITNYMARIKSGDSYMDKFTERDRLYNEYMRRSTITNWGSMNPGGHLSAYSMSIDPAMIEKDLSKQAKNKKLLLCL